MSASFTSNDSYHLDAESGAEMARLLQQDRLLTWGMGGPLSERSDLSAIHRILDLACGPGGWVLDVAQTHPDKEVVGVDLSQEMVEYAQAQTQVQGLTNAQFQVMDITKPFNFPDNSFDLVNARLIGFFTPATWQALLQECFRVARPGGIIRLTETELGVSTSPALEQLMSMFSRAFRAAGKSFSPDGRWLGTTAVLSTFLRRVGCHTIGLKAHVIDYSAGTQAHAGFYQNWQVGFQLIQPFFVHMGVTTSAEMKQVYEQMLHEMMAEDFCANYFLVTAWGTKPQASRG
jgi:ubiquinone/menaquinone biosynthesis C-methylase UbiE